MAVAWLLACAGAGQARAAPPFAMTAGQVRVDVPDECGAPNEFERQALRRLGPLAKIPPVQVEITREAPDRYRLLMQAGGESRELHDADCRQLFQAAIVVTVALALSETPLPTQGESASPRQSSDPMPDRDADRRDPRDNGDHHKTSDDHERPSPTQADLLAGIGLNTGLLPQTAVAFALEARAMVRQFGLAASGRYLAPVTGYDNAEHGVRMEAAGGQVAGVYRPIGMLELRLGAAAYALLGRGLGSGGRSDVAWGTGPTTGASLVQLYRGRLTLAVGADLHWNVLRPSFEVLSYGTVFASSPFDLWIFFNVGPHFP